MRCGLFIVLMAALSAQAEWTVLKNCRMAESESNDADSFMVESKTSYRGETKNRFRLYFVDAAETDANSDFKKERLLDQAKYWESNDPDFALKMGMRAEQKTKRLLRGGFDVYTQGEYAPTMGAPRYYGLIHVKDRWLDEVLVEYGLARIYGKGSDLPDGSAAKDHWRKLHELERTAKSKKQNGWLNAIVEEEVQEFFEPYDAVLQSVAWIYSIKDGHKVTVLRKGTQVTVVAPAEDGRIRIRFEKNGKVYEGLCAKKSLTP